MEARAIARFVRMGPRKIGRVLSLIRKKPVVQAFTILKFTPKAATKVVEKVLKSAVANSGKKREELYVKNVWVGPGPSFKRMRPMAMGRAGIIRRRTAHLTLIVSDELIRTQRSSRTQVREARR